MSPTLRASPGSESAHVSQSQKILVNLPPSFFPCAVLQPQFERLGSLGAVRTTSHDNLEPFLKDLASVEAAFMWSWPELSEESLRATKLRFLGQINTTGLTARACLSRGVALSEARHCWSPAVAEMALGLILSGLRGIGDYHASMRSGTEKWVQVFPADISPRERELTGRRVGIVGFGGIGRRLAELLQPFRTELLVHDPFISPRVAEEAGVRNVGLHELLSACEVVVLAAPGSHANRALLGQAEIDLLPKDSLLVNVSRASLVDTAALIRRLRKGDLIALLDVFDEEPLAGDSPLRKIPGAYLTPHRAGGLLSSVQRALEMLLDDFEAFLAGNPRRYAITEEMLKCF